MVQSEMRNFITFLKRFMFFFINLYWHIYIHESVYLHVSIYQSGKFVLCWKTWRMVFHTVRKTARGSLFHSVVTVVTGWMDPQSVSTWSTVHGRECSQLVNLVRVSLHNYLECLSGKVSPEKIVISLNDNRRWSMSLKVVSAADEALSKVPVNSVVCRLMMFRHLIFLHHRSFMLSQFSVDVPANLWNPESLISFVCI